ncbi:MULTISPECIES: tripartite tricarboxylate transporter substrate binding protein [unclassified Variovorax]|uniref:Bug family tripartite tricarboxylate transporter substrate binding protein n=1 Tax=unclassified Variovorax TaxID=663243 RepID=UPI002B221CAD|nr:MULTISPECIES: tripartite tricarboxylate transporter substrate binding protein [unclassified Variovorax]MEB0056052.1 tripartite tricarboxylate transporter substrate binding protein [Variovorax sp. LG9.2]MEB0111189.1 tripartite tricarboxylate transporter substrate binding protein [Variovorax sp. RTB1]
MIQRRVFATALPTFAAAVAAAALLPSLALAQAPPWPTKQSIRIISPYAPGGTTDVLARLLAQPLQQKLGQTVIVENKGGAGGNVGTDYVAKAAPDGYTLLLAASGPIVISPSLYAKIPYDSIKDFTFVAPIANASFVVLANPASGITSIKDLIARAKKGEKINFASAGSGTPQHIIGEMFNQAAGIKMQHIPYKGSGPAMNDLLAGQVPISFENPVPAMPHVKAGKVKVLASTGAVRSAAFPDIPTVAELGLPGFDAKPWYGLMAPAGLDPAIAKKLNDAVREALSSTEMKARLFTLGAEPMAMTTPEFQAFAEKDRDKWTKVVKTSGATPD